MTTEECLKAKAVISYNVNGVWDFYPTLLDAEAMLPTVKKELEKSVKTWERIYEKSPSHYNKTTLESTRKELEYAQVMTYDEFNKKQHDAQFSHFRVIDSEEEYMGLIEQMPPHRMFEHEGVGFYDCLELDCGHYRTSWINYNGKYYAMTVSDAESKENRVRRFTVHLADIVNT